MNQLKVANGVNTKLLINNKKRAREFFVSEMKEYIPPKFDFTCEWTR